MKRSSLYIIAAVVTIGSLLSSCDKKIDALAPHNVLFEDQEFSTAAGFTKATIGNYSLIATSEYDANWFNLSEFRGNNVTVIDLTSSSSLSDAQNVDAFKFINASSKDFSLSYRYWMAAYKALLSINTVLKHVNTGEANAEILQAKAENLFMRATIYFNLVRLYGRPYYQSPATNPGVPVILKPIESVNDRPVRASVEDTYKQIIADLTEAANTFTQKKVNSFAGRYAAFALLSRVYLYMSGTFTQPNTTYAKLSVQYADSVILNGGYRLLQGAEYTAYYNNSNQANAETIWAVNHDAGSTSIPTLIYQPTGPYLGSSSYSTGQIKPSPDLLGLLQSNDLRKTFYVTDKYPNNNTDTLACRKYMYKYVSVYTSNAPVHYLRLAEMYLNRAEAKVKGSDNAGALTDLNTIRQRAGIGDAAVGLTGQPLFDEIMKQRRLELAFEGHNSFDYFRNGLPMVRTYASFNSPPVTIAATDKKVVMRIADDILTENSNVQQNDQ